MRGTYGLCCVKQERPLPALLAALLHNASPQPSSRDTEGGAVLGGAVRGCCADSAESPRENLVPATYSWRSRLAEQRATARGRHDDLGRPRWCIELARDLEAIGWRCLTGRGWLVVGLESVAHAWLGDEVAGVGRIGFQLAT
jgi:hypothetical protein